MAYKLSITPEIERLTEVCLENSRINPDLYKELDIKRGLRDVNGAGVRAGLTKISTINSFKMIDGVKTPCEGELYYRGIDIHELTDGFINEKRFGFEEMVYLLLFGKLPTDVELADFIKELANQRALPRNFVRDVIMKAPSKDMMNTLARSVSLSILMTLLLMTSLCQM